MYEIELHGEAVAGEAASTRAHLETIITDVNRSNFDIGDLLHKIKKQGYYQQWGYNTLKEYTDTLQIKPRKAQYLRGISEVMEAVGVKREQYEPVGVGKLRDITSLDPTAVYTNPQTNEQTPMSEFIVGFVEKHAELSADEIAQHVRTLKGLVGDEDICFLNIAVKRAALDNTIRPALELAKNAIGSVGKDEDGMSKDASDGAALEYISADFSSDPANNVLGEDDIDATTEG